MALVMVVIFSVLLVVLVSSLVFTAEIASTTGRNDALLASMENHLSLTYLEIEQQLKDDLEGGDAEGALGGGGEGGANPLGGGSAGGAGGEGGGAGGAGGEEEAPPSDSSQDAWFQPTAYADGDLTTYVWVEDENRKFNILALASPDQEFADESKDRLERLIVALREDTAFEISRSDAATIVNSIDEWLRGQNRDEDNRPKPKLKSDDEKDDKFTIPLHLDELLLLRGVTESMFYDLVEAGPPPRVLPGLESVLTIYTSYRADPGDPEKLAAQARNNPGGNNNAGGNNAGGNNAGGGNSAGGNNAGGNNAGPGGAEAAPEPEGQGIRININTAPRAVLRALFSENEISDTVIDAILAYRNEEAEEEESAEGEGDPTEYSGDIEEGLEPPRKIFESLEDLDEVPEFANLSDDKIKGKFLDLLTTQSDVFTIHMACLFKKSEKRKVFVMNRRRAVVVRLEGDDSTRIFPIIRMERCKGLRVFAVDFPEQEAERRSISETDMDDFSKEERKWNPFFVEFYEKSEDAITNKR